MITGSLLWFDAKSAYFNFVSIVGDSCTKGAKTHILVLF